MLYQTYLNKMVKAAPLAVFRILFGALMTISLIRFWVNGWIEKLYLEPYLHFKYYGFDFIEVPGNWVYAIFLICILASLGIVVGWKYRWAIILFFLSFTYIELMDKTTYLNHYYFVSVISFLLIWLPANCTFSLDARRYEHRRYEYIPAWNIDVIKLMLAIVYLYAGLAKLNHDWLLKAMPLSIWLSAKAELPIIGTLLQQQWAHFFFSWSGLIYDLGIVFLLLWKKTRLIGFALVVIFHILTRILFPIGMFPYIMIVSTLIYFSPKWHEQFLDKLSLLLKISSEKFKNNKAFMVQPSIIRRLHRIGLSAFVMIQLLFPWRYLLYPGNLFWTEEGYRFSWRVMLMEKTGYTQFKIVDGQTKKRFFVQNEDFLTPLQQKQMSTQPDMILEYAHFLGDHFSQQGHRNIEIYADSHVALNGRKSTRFIDPNANLLEFQEGWSPKKFILPFED